MIDAVHVDPARETVAPPLRQGSAAANGDTFSGMLEGVLQESRGLSFSAHARQRIDERNIQLTSVDHARIAASTDAASARGAREALLLMDRIALVVGVPNRTVITVMEPHKGEHTVFTNIDSVVVVADRGR